MGQHCGTISYQNLHFECTAWVYGEGILAGSPQKLESRAIEVILNAKYPNNRVHSVELAPAKFNAMRYISVLGTEPGTERLDEEYFVPRRIPNFNFAKRHSLRETLHSITLSQFG